MSKRAFVILSFILLSGYLSVAYAESVGADFVASASDEQVKIEIIFFHSVTCPHCVKAKAFLERLSEKYQVIDLKEFEISERENIEFLKKLYAIYKIPSNAQGFVPVTFIRDRYFLGYESDETTGKRIADYIQEIKNGFSGQSADYEASIIQVGQIKIPFLGKIDISRFSLAGAAIVLGTLDGFNACAMAALGFLLAVLVSTGIRKRIILIGGTFILISGLVYFAFISLWLNLFIALQHVKFITFLVGIFVILFSVFLLKDYFHGIVCKFCEVGNGKESIFVRFERMLFEKMEKISAAKGSLLFTLLGVAAIAAGVNTVELACSFGLPMVFTKMLASASISTFSYYIYLMAYIGFYMLDDLLVFFIAVLTLRVATTSQRYLKAIKLISGILLLLLGFIMLFKPSMLTLG